MRNFGVSEKLYLKTYSLGNVKSIYFDKFDLLVHFLSSMTTRVTSLEQLSLAEFTRETARPKVYENNHKNTLAFWFDLVLNVKIWAHF